MKMQTLKRLAPWIDTFAIALWGILLLKYWLTGKLNILIHPAYHWLCIVGGVGLLAICGLKFSELWRRGKYASESQSMLPHVTLFPPGWSTTFLIVAAIAGLMFTPRPFSSQTALQTGVSDILTATRSQPRSFRNSQNPEDRSILDWVRTLNVYPEPDAYTGQQVNVSGFVLHPPDFPENYTILSRFVITCCAADAYPIGLPVKLPADSKKYPADTWLQVRGTMATETLLDRRKLVIQARSIAEIPEPKNPYAY
jgi:uncharacterized repeat protein (TIGR03943 family)